MASTWVKLDDDFFDHPKVIGLSLVAVHVHLRAICWCSKHLTDGRIPLAVVESWSVRRWRDAIDSLVDRGLWERPTVDLGSTYGLPTVRDPKVANEVAAFIRAKLREIGFDVNDSKSSMICKVGRGAILTRVLEDGSCAAPTVAINNPEEDEFKVLALRGMSIFAA